MVRGKTVQQVARAGSRAAASRSRDDGHDHVVGHQLPGRHVLLGLHADFGLGVAGGAEHVAGGQMGQVVRLDQPLGLGAFAGARRSDEDDSHEIRVESGIGIGSQGEGSGEVGRGNVSLRCPPSLIRLPDVL